MYHISKDKRAKKSAELVYQGLLTCLKHKNFDQITVTDLQKASGVARTTFYRAFDNISDILYWKCDLCFQEVLGSFKEEQFANEMELVRQYFSYWMGHKDILELLMKINRYDMIYSCHMNAALTVQKKFGSRPDMQGIHSNYFLAIRTGFTISILTAWLQGGEKESIDEIIEIVNEQLALMPYGKTHS
jgi:AcrR family transcriptional regulator